VKVLLELELDLNVRNFEDARRTELALMKSINQPEHAVLTVQGYGQDVIIRKVLVKRKDIL
jgi:hypothetical protein